MRWCTRWDQSFHVFLLKFWLSISDNTSTNCWYFPNRKSTRFLGNLFFPQAGTYQLVDTLCHGYPHLGRRVKSALKFVDSLIFDIRVCLKMGDPLWKNFHLGVSNPEVKWQLFWAPSFQTNWQRGEPLGQLEKWRNIVSRELLPGSEVK